MDIFKQYIDLLLKYNKVHRLSGSKNEDEVIKNIIDSLYPEEFIDFNKKKSLLDIGSGAGFPGMIIAIKYPHLKVTLVEPLMKRSAFLHLVKSTYDLNNVTIYQNRIEEIDSFFVDIITSRAVAKSDILISLAKSFITDKTELLFYKGEEVFNEIGDSYDCEVIPNGKRNFLYIKGFK